MIFFKNFILKISSLKFAIILIIFIAIASGVGTFIPQGNVKQEYIDFYNQNPIFGFINGSQVLKLQLDHVYTSNWFLFSLVLLCISLAACSIRRQIPSLKAALKWKYYKDEKNFYKLQLTSNYEIIQEINPILKADSLLRKKGWSISKFENCLSARKGLAGKLGPIIVHIGLIILLIGSAYGNFSSESKEQYLRLGESLDLINESADSKVTIKLNKFLIERETDGKPKQFISNLNFFSNEQPLNEIRTTQVNRPIRYKGLTIYQADWSISNIIVEIDSVLYQLQLKPIPEIGDQIWGLLIELGKENKKNYLLTIDNENGPLKVTNIEDFSKSFIFLNDDSIEINSSSISLKQIIPSSGLIIKNDPSIPFIYFSFTLIIFGTLCSLIPTNQLWILFSANSKRLFIGGLSNRNLIGFKREFLELSDQIKNC